ncbi:MAG: hypothetical protein AUI36_24885 [Cyanobacteria bacterium 13_1_40CM_2_61_4]|nr:MAG: hypothetical protein AUI36_24885 [Cyanobacteria bacterium 13_1_40CM_2_61_4]
MDTPLTSKKWRQFVEDVHLRWPLLDPGDNIKTTNEIVDRLSRSSGLSRSRSQREVKEMIELFKEKLRRAA